MPGAGRTEPRAAGAGLALPSAPALQQNPQQGLSLHLFCFTQDAVGHWGLIPSLSSIKVCGAPLWAPLPLQLPLSTSQCLHSARPAAAQGPSPWPCSCEGALCESSPHPVTDSCTFTLTNGAFPKVGMVLEAQLNCRAQPAEPQSSTDPTQPCVGAHWHPEGYPATPRLSHKGRSTLGTSSTPMAWPEACWGANLSFSLVLP